MSKTTLKQPQEDEVHHESTGIAVTNVASGSFSRGLDADESPDAFDSNQISSHAEVDRTSLSLSRAQTTPTEEAVVLDDAKVVQFSESPTASAARASLARFAQAAKAQRQRLALDAATSPPTSPAEAATRAREAYLKHLASELTHGANYAAVEAATAAAAALPRNEVSRLLAEVGLEQHYAALVSECCGGDVSIAAMAQQGESRLHATLEALGVPRVRARKLWKRLDSRIAAVSPTSEAVDEGTPSMEPLALPNAISPAGQLLSKLLTSSGENPQLLLPTPEIPDKVHSCSAQDSTSIVTAPLSASSKTRVLEEEDGTAGISINASAARRGSFRGRQQTMRETSTAGREGINSKLTKDASPYQEHSGSNNSSDTHVNSSSNGVFRESFASTTSPANHQSSCNSNSSKVSTDDSSRGSIATAVTNKPMPADTSPVEPKECSSSDLSVPHIETPTVTPSRNVNAAEAVDLGESITPPQVSPMEIEARSTGGTSETPPSAKIATLAHSAISPPTSVVVSPPGSLRTSTSRQLTSSSAARITSSSSRSNNENARTVSGNSGGSSNSRSRTRSSSPRSPAVSATTNSVESPRSPRLGASSASASRSRSRSPRAGMGKGGSPSLRSGRGDGSAGSVGSPRASARRVGTASPGGGLLAAPSAVKKPLSTTKRNSKVGTAHGKLHTPSVSASELSGLLARVAERPRMRSFGESDSGSFRAPRSPPAFSQVAASSPTASAMAAATAWMTAAKAVVVAQQSTASNFQGTAESTATSYSTSSKSMVLPSSANLEQREWHFSPGNSKEALETKPSSSLNLEAPSSEDAFERAAINAAGSTEI